MWHPAALPPRHKTIMGPKADFGIMADAPSNASNERPQMGKLGLWRFAPCQKPDFAIINCCPREHFFC